jgi:hypothetical protein
MALYGLASMKKYLVPAIGLILVYHVLFALSLANQRCLDEVLPAPACRTPASLWVNPLTDAATLTTPGAAAFGIKDKNLATGFRVGFDFAASAVAEKKLNDSARKYFDLYAMLLPYRVMVEESGASKRPLPFSLSITSVDEVQADQQGQVMLFTQARSKDGQKFVLVCHSAQPTCAHLQTGVDFTFTVLQTGDPDYAYGYTEQENAVVVSTSGHLLNGAVHESVFSMSKAQEESGAQASDAATVTRPDVPAVTVSTPNRVLELIASNGVCGVDYLNTPVSDGDTTVPLKDGKYEQRENLGGQSVVTVKHVSCLDHGVAERALLTTDWMSCGASCNDSGIVQVFELRDGHPVLIQQIGFDSDARGTGANFDENSQTLTITGRSNEDSPHCCPKSLDMVTYRWTGQQFVQGSYTRVPVPNS